MYIFKAFSKNKEPAYYQDAPEESCSGTGPTTTNQSPDLSESLLKTALISYPCQCSRQKGKTFIPEYILRLSIFLFFLFRRLDSFSVSHFNF